MKTKRALLTPGACRGCSRRVPSEGRYSVYFFVTPLSTVFNDPSSAPKAPSCRPAPFQERSPGRAFGESNNVSGPVFFPRQSSSYAPIRSGAQTPLNLHTELPERAALNGRLANTIQAASELVELRVGYPVELAVLEPVDRGGCTNLCAHWRAVTDRKDACS
jgi:hypothetical protein